MSSEKYLLKDNKGNLHTLSVKQVADLLGHTTSSVAEKYYVKREMKNLQDIIDDFSLYNINFISHFLKRI